MNYLMERQEAGEVVTGLLYVDKDPEDLHANFNTTATPLNALGEKELCPGSARARQDQRRLAVVRRLRRMGRAVGGRPQPMWPPAMVSLALTLPTASSEEVVGEPTARAPRTSGPQQGNTHAKT